MSDTQSNNEPLIEDDGSVKGVDYKEWNGVDLIESLCMNCGENGQTRLMLHKIPYFRELIIASFFCEHCGERNNEVTFGGEIQLQGCVYELQVTTARDLDRQLIKSDSATVRLKELDFEIPPLTQKGEISTIEGILRTAAKNLALYQPQRMEETPEIGAKVAEVIMSLTLMASGSESMMPFTIAVDDPAGNSYVENLMAPQVDPHMTSRHYKRSALQDESLGLEADKGVFRDDKDSNFQALMQSSSDGGTIFGAVKSADVTPLAPPSSSNSGINFQRALEESADSVRLGRSEAVSIPSQCPNCRCEGESLTAFTDIPHFKEVIIMAFMCQSCGFRNNEVKGGGAVPPCGCEVRLTVSGPDDLKRDLLKSDSAMVMVPELELELGPGTLGGVFTTVEGLLTKIRRSLQESNPFAVGDSTTLHHSEDASVVDSKSKFVAFLSQLEDLGAGKRFPFTVVLRDPLANSFISAPLGSFLPPELDLALVLSDFERSFEENEDLGLNDINTADFETGVDHSAVIVSDRASTAAYVKGPDHPTPFAKGTADHDNTQGGVYFPSASGSVGQHVTQQDDGTSSEDGPLYCEAPAGWSVARSEEQEESFPTTAAAHVAPVHHRVFSDDSKLQFEGYEEFSGRRAGRVFRLGSQGLGYYEDSQQQQQQSAEVDSV